MRIVVQKWMQAVLVPVAALVALYLLPKISHAVFIFLMAALFALLLNPVVMMLQRARIPRPVGVLGCIWLSRSCWSCWWLSPCRRLRGRAVIWWIVLLAGMKRQMCGCLVCRTT